MWIPGESHDTSCYIRINQDNFLFACQSFGQDTESIITLNLPGGVFPFIVKGCLCFSLFFTYPSKSVGN